MFFLISHYLKYSLLGDFGFWILDFGFWILDFGFWILDFGFWILNWELGSRIFSLVYPYSPLLTPYSSSPNYLYQGSSLGLSLNNPSNGPRTAPKRNPPACAQ
ncbi:hypothetical protein WA1_41090 [Scytonema hofmannii PCC 7110]|uniref:Uncharacterized protein n=1 Tax=Scytonema hofmannii PCC 7110 TaxID=128403 RepID=A0A139WUM6_9CYAN|nr:hypothetical protein WA1_41090 [Scytonema hofmannii PCC 7110]